MRLVPALAFTVLAMLPRAAADDRTDLAALRDAWAADLRDKRLEASLARYAPDAVFYNPDGSSVAGSVQIRALFEQVMRTWNSSLKFHPSWVSVSGDLAVDSGDYDETLTPRNDTAAMNVHGHYLTVLSRGRDGRWHIERQMWSVRPAAPP